LPDTQDELIRLYTFSEPDLSLIRQRRGDANRLGVAVQLCLLRFPGQGPAARRCGADAPAAMDRTATAHRSIELATSMQRGRNGASIWLSCVHIWAWSRSAWRTIGRLSSAATELALQTDKGIMLANSVLDDLRHRHVILPTLDVVERVCAEAITRANRRLRTPCPNRYRTRIVAALTTICSNAGTTARNVAGLAAPVTRQAQFAVLEHIERLKAWQALDLPSGVERSVHQNRRCSRSPARAAR
jgi:hypothetical protein